MIRQRFYSLFQACGRSIALNNPARQKFGVYVAGAIASGFATYSVISNVQNPIRLDVEQIQRHHKFITPASVETSQPATKVDPFPVSFTSYGEKFSLLGTGVRTVSFLNLHVYAVGLYIADSDKPKVKQLIGGATEDDLLDKDKSGELISKLLNGGVRFDIRIVPVRNTDFGHLRDGLVRTIMANPRFKSEGNNEEVGEGIQELKRVFGRKMTMAKNKVLHLNRDRDGVLEAVFYKADKEDDCSEPLEMGKATHPLVSEFLLLQYLSGAKPSSESARAAAVKTLAGLAK